MPEIIVRIEIVSPTLNRDNRIEITRTAMPLPVDLAQALKDEAVFAADQALKAWIAS
jgi:hypothetical protein